MSSLVPLKPKSSCDPTAAIKPEAISAPAEARLKLARDGSLTARLGRAVVERDVARPMQGPQEMGSPLSQSRGFRSLYLFRIESQS